jgi:hypothetical protein
LECPLEPESQTNVALAALLKMRTPAFLARLRRSFQPKRVVSISGKLDHLLSGLTEIDLSCELVTDSGKSFALDGGAPDQSIARLRDVLATSKVVSR